MSMITLPDSVDSSKIMSSPTKNSFNYGHIDEIYLNDNIFSNPADMLIYPQEIEPNLIISNSSSLFDLMNIDNNNDDVRLENTFSFNFEDYFIM